MVEELIIKNSATNPEGAKTTEQQEEEKIELLKLIEEKIPNFWEEDYQDISISDLVAKIDSGNLEMKNEIVDALLKKYYDNCEISRDSNIFIETPHGKVPSLAETKLMLRQYDDFKDVDNENIEVAYSKVKEELITVEDDSEQTFMKRKTELKKDYKKGSLELRILNIMAGSDVYISKLAEVIAGNEFNYTTPGVSRKLDDPNREPGDRKIKGKTKRLESGHGTALARHYALERMVKRNQDQTESENNFYHITLLERDSREPFTIGVAEHDGMLPCSIKIAGYVAEELKTKLEEQGILKNDGSRYDVVLGREGNFKGAKVNTQRRWGNEGMELGGKYNTIQLAIPSLVLKQHGSEIAKILQEIFSDLQA